MPNYHQSPFSADEGDTVKVYAVIAGYTAGGVIDRLQTYGSGS